MHLDADRIARHFLELPCFSEPLTRLIQQTQDPDTPPRAIAATISADPNLAMRLLQLANSPFYGVARHVISIEQAVILLGRAQIRNLA